MYLPCISQVSILVKGAISNATWDRLGDDLKGKLALHYLRKVFGVKNASGSHDDYALGKTKIFFRPGVWEQCKHRQLEFETLAKAVFEARKRRDMKAKLAKLKADLKDQSQRNAMRRASIVDTEAQKREEEVHPPPRAARLPYIGACTKCMHPPPSVYRPRRRRCTSR